MKLDHVLQSIRTAELLVYPIGISPLTYARNTVPGSIDLPGAAFLRRRKLFLKTAGTKST